MKPVPLADDLRWQRLRRGKVRCVGCGETHGGLFDLAAFRPEPWTGPDDYEDNAAVLAKTHVLTEDFCILDGEHFFVRCVLEIPIAQSGGERFGFGVWSTLSKTNFERYLGVFDEGAPPGLGPWFGWFSNRLKGYPDTLNLKCQVHPQLARQRPVIELEPTDHPLAIEQREGITLDRMLAIYALYGHDFGLGEGYVQD